MKTKKAIIFSVILVLILITAIVLKELGVFARIAEWWKEISEPLKSAL